jgi:23S rRNA pseudouridine1911/1915/1917 synthase
MTPHSSPDDNSTETDESSNSIHQTAKMNAPDELKNPSAELEEAEIVSFEIASEEAGGRLDAFLASRISERSRARLKRAIDDGEVTVDGKIVKPSYKLRAGERIEVELTAAAVIDETLTPEPIPLEIVYEDDQLVVINKRAGMVVHPGAGIFSGTLANALLFHFGSELSENAGRIRPGIVHRLDRDTSGLIVVAKTEGAHAALGDQFRAREVYKSYVALVHGRVKEERGKIDEPIGRDPRHRTRMAVARRSGREALSLFRVRRVYGRFTLLDVEIKTGRTHQIRVHLAWLKHPVVGDEIYGAGRDTSIQDAALRIQIQKLGRQFLHAAVLRFCHPVTAAPLSFKVELPAELNDFLDYLNMRDEAATGYN